jgi:gluconolactonase
MTSKNPLVPWSDARPLAALAVLLLILGPIAPVEAEDERSKGLPPSYTVEPQLFATGFAFAEGPALDADGNLYVVNYRELGTIGRITTDGTAGIFCNLVEQSPVEGRRPQANGLKIDSEGRLIVADAGAGRLLRVSEDGDRVEVLADRWEGKRFNLINDVALDRRGNIFFTDPGQSSKDNPIGSVYLYDIGTKRVQQLDTGLAYPNGIAVSADQRQLCVAETAEYRVVIYNLDDQGRATDRRVLVDFLEDTEGTLNSGEFKPDGMVFDTENRLYVAIYSHGVINVVDVPTGELLRQYDAGGGKATNCHFHDGWLYTTIAAKEAVFRLKLGVDGFDYNGAP